MEAHPSLPVKTGTRKIVEYECRRKGVIGFCMIFEPLTGHLQVKILNFRARKDFAYPITPKFTFRSLNQHGKCVSITIEPANIHRCGFSQE